MTNHRIVSQSEWLEASRAQLAKEKRQWQKVQTAMNQVLAE